jgi:hypothetical protein
LSGRLEALDAGHEAFRGRDVLVVERIEHHFRTGPTGLRSLRILLRQDRLAAFDVAGGRRFREVPEHRFDAGVDAGIGGDLRGHDFAPCGGSLRATLGA